MEGVRGEKAFIEVAGVESSVAAPRSTLTIAKSESAKRIAGYGTKKAWPYAQEPSLPSFCAGPATAAALNRQRLEGLGCK